MKIMYWNIYDVTYRTNCKNIDKVWWSFRCCSTSSSSPLKFKMKNINKFIMGSINTYFFSFYKQPIYKQLTLGWQIAKQLSGLNPLLLSNNKNYKLKFFLCNKHKTAVKPTIHQNSENFGRIVTSLIIYIAFVSWKLAILSPKNLESISNFEGWGLTLVAYKKQVYQVAPSWINVSYISLK